MSRELLAFKASWCAPCKGMEPILDSLQDDGLVVKKLDVEAQIEEAKEFQVRAVPTYVILEDGKEIERLVGAQSKDKLQDLLKT